jgi:predicted nucleic acid-binding Zn ribbon protein
MPVGILFKGSGFYATDHRSPSGQSPAKKHEESKAAEQPKSDPEPKSSKDD